MLKLLIPALFLVSGTVMATPKTGTAAPCLEFNHLAFDGTVNKRSTCDSEKAGQNLVISFFAVWCHYCVQDLPMFNDLATKYHGQAIFRVMGVDKEKSLREYFKGIDFKNYEVGLDEKLTSVDAFNVENIPTLVVIGPNKEIKYVYVGVIDAKVLPEIENAILH